MFGKFFIVSFLMLISMVIIVNAQQPKRTPYPESKYNREPNDERLKKISMRLELTDDDYYKNKKPITKFSIEKNIYLQIFAKSKDSRIIALGFSEKRRFTPLLINDKGIIPFTNQKQEQLRVEWERVELMKSGNTLGWRSGPSDFIGEDWSKWMFNIADWYGKLEPGNYKVAVFFGFGESENEKKIKTKFVKFKIY